MITPIALQSECLKSSTPTVFEQYEFRGWLITIENYRSSNDLIGFATPTKYAHLLDVYNYIFIEEIAKENGINPILNDDGDEHYGDFDYLVAEPDDVVVNFLAEVDTKNSSCVLEYMVKKILDHTQSNYKNRKTEIIILKQIQKKSVSPKVGKRKSGFLSLAWSAMVKERDKKCTRCGSVYDLHAHHIKQYKSNPELKYCVDNGLTLCGNCHRNHHAINGK